MSKRKMKRDLALDQELIGENVGFYAAEAYKRLRTNLSFCVPQNGNCRVIGITSSMRGEGKSTTAINLAYLKESLHFLYVMRIQGFLLKHLLRKLSRGIWILLWWEILMRKLKG